MKILTLRFTRLTGRARCALRVSVIGTDRVRGYGTALMTARRLHVPEISRGRLAVTSGLLKTIGAPPWAIMPLSIVTGAAVVFSHERATGMTTESQTSSIFAKTANSGPGSLPNPPKGRFSSSATWHAAHS